MSSWYFTCRSVDKSYLPSIPNPVNPVQHLLCMLSLCSLTTKLASASAVCWNSNVLLHYCLKRKIMFIAKRNHFILHCWFWILHWKRIRRVSFLLYGWALEVLDTLKRARYKCLWYGDVLHTAWLKTRLTFCLCSSFITLVQCSCKCGNSQEGWVQIWPMSVL